MPTSLVNRLIINVNQEINPCHNPAQKPAGSASNRIFPGAQEVRIKMARMKNGSHRLIFETFMVFEIRKYENKKYEIRKCEIYLS